MKINRFPYLSLGFMIKMFKKLSITLLVVFSLCCSERTKDNPFDPSGKIQVKLSILSFDERVELSWDNPDVSGYKAFNVYRREEGVDDNFKKIAENIPPDARRFDDNKVDYEKTYHYFITVRGNDIESQPSEKVSITPGPGLNWIVDKWGYQIIKTTYDVEHTILTYETNWPPTDMALSKDIGTAIILYQGSGTVEEIDLSGGFQNRYDQIKYPTAVVFEPVDSQFWIADSSGSLYKLDTQNDQVRVIYNSLSKPVALHIAPAKNLISVVDIGSKEIVQFNRFGQRLNSIRFINGERLEGPSRFVIDEGNDRYWLIDGNESIDYIYTRQLQENTYSLIDSLEDAGDLEAGFLDGTAWIGSIDIPNSLVLQLSPAGTRQLQLSGFYYAYDLQINPYDGTLLLIDLRNTEKDRVMHYNQSHKVIGFSNIYNTPVKVLVE